jgi:hypothetical protein
MGLFTMIQQTGSRNTLPHHTWICWECGKLNRVSRVACSGCWHVRWEHLGFTLVATNEMRVRLDVLEAEVEDD